MSRLLSWEEPGTYEVAQDRKEWEETVTNRI